MPFVRFAVEVLSAMYAWAVEIVAPAIPAPIRATNNQVRLRHTVAKPNKRVEHRRTGQARSTGSAAARTRPKAVPTPGGR